MSSTWYTQDAGTHRRIVRSNTRTLSGVAVSLLRHDAIRKGFFVKTTLIIIVLTLLAGFGLTQLWNKTITAQESAVSYTQPIDFPDVTYYPLTDEAIWAEVQGWRMTENKPIYIKDDQACELAQKRLEETKLNWSHDGFWDEDCLGCSYWGENLARGFVSADAMLEAWLNSPKHAENLNSPYFTHSCIAHDSGYVVHFFVGY